MESAAAGKSLTVVGSAVTGEGFLNLLQALDKALRCVLSSCGSRQQARAVL